MKKTPVEGIPHCLIEYAQVKRVTVERIMAQKTQPRKDQDVEPDQCVASTVKELFWKIEDWNKMATRIGDPAEDGGTD